MRHRTADFRQALGFERRVGVFQVLRTKRFELDRENRLLFINFEGLHIAHKDEIAEIEHMVISLLDPVVKSPGERLAVVVNYDNFSILPGLVDEYSTMVTRLTDRFYSRVTRYGTGGFLKARLDGRLSS